MELFDWLKNPENLKAVAPFIAPFITILFSGVVIGIGFPALVNWRKRQRKKQIPAGITPLLVLPPGSKDVLRQLMGATEQNQNDPLADFNMLYQQRQPDREIRRELETALRANDWVEGNSDKSIDYLRQAIQLDPNHYINLARQDDDFRSIQNDPRFIALLNP
jgi:hypothetical protein